MLLVHLLTGELFSESESPLVQQESSFRQREFGAEQEFDVERFGSSVYRTSWAALPKSE